MAAERKTIPVDGLAQPVAITVDRWGIAHIRAKTPHDLFFAQGFNAARDRLWQIDLWRKRGLGLLAADFGPGYLEQDRAARLFLYRGEMEKEWAAYSNDAREICEAFVAGINAYVDLTDREPERLPPEFAAMRTRPAKWQAEDVVLVRSHSLMRNAMSEVIRANVLRSAGPAANLLRQNLEPAVTPHLADALADMPIPIEVLDVFKLAVAPVTFGRERLAATAADAPRWRKVTPLGDVVRDATMQGSNNWVVHGSRTTTGRPILANDPHRTHAVPALRYLVHLTAPGLDVIGAGEPSLPGISIGHNGTIAFGLTLFFGPDQEDIYVYETAPDDPNLYRYAGGWEAMRVVEESVAVKGATPETLTLKFTRHGPVIYADRANHCAFAIRSVWFEPGAAAYFVSIASMRAKNFGEFRTIMARWAVPAVNQVYADTSGTIAWVAAGFSPIRPNWDGLLPVPGDGSHEWDGYLVAGDLPFVENPPAGHFATANEMNLPHGWPHAEKQVGYEWIEGSRAARLAEAFADKAPHSVETSRALQTDIMSLPARRLAVLLLALKPQNTEEEKALTLLAEWDYRLSADSAAAALFEVWWTKYLRPAVFERFVSDPTIRLLLGLGDPAGVLNALENPGPEFGPAPEKGRDKLLLESLVEAYRTCVALLGGDPSRWAWGDLHKGYFEHALSPLAIRDLAATLDVGPFPLGGSDSTPMNTSYRPGDFRLTIGASVRVIIDVGDWDKSVCSNTPGQSGDPRSPNYANLAPIWAKGDYIPMLYSRPAIEREAELELTLQPVRP